MDKLLNMSTKASSRLEVVQRLSEKRMPQKEAGKILQFGVRQIKRLLKAYRKLGAAGLVSKHRGESRRYRSSVPTCTKPKNGNEGCRGGAVARAVLQCC
ncbi:MAG: helix-turn-helix domain-containing protein [Anaerolineales bacterium]